MAAYTERTGQKVTYQQLAEHTGLSKATLEALGSREDYNTTLSTIDALCAYLGCQIQDLLEFTTESGKNTKSNRKS
jgi:putative transcriptional regulator